MSISKIKQALKSRFPSQTRLLGDTYRWIFRIRHDLGEELRYRKIYAMTSFHGEDQVLEVGKCNTQTRKIATAVRQITVCDITGEDREAPVYGPKNIRWVRGDICDHPFENNFFDKAFVMAVLEHIENDEAAAENLFRILKPGGILFVYVPDTDSHLPEWKRGDFPDHVRPGYTREKMEQLLTDAGFEIVWSEMPFSCYSQVAADMYYRLNNRLRFFKRLPHFLVTPFLRFAAQDDNVRDWQRMGVLVAAKKPKE